ncbi:MAG TPA: VCBS repeat-containing protein, partial [Pirellulaceae bacterium]|nr:VCBS repeat-containing protein [Pirellulaceae bacterium]
ETCINNYWYQAYAGGEWWNMSHGEPYMLRSFAGSTEKLAAIVTAMVAGQEVVVPCMVDGDKQALQTRSGRIQRLRASLKIQDYNAQRDFAGWGGDDFRTLAGMPAFSHYAGVARTDPDAGGIAVADVDGDGKDDVCYYGAGKVTVLRVEGSSLSEVALPITGGARSAAFGDANGDGKPDLLLATPSGPKLLINQGGTFKDESAGLPREPYYQLSAAAWIDHDGDGRQDIVLANGYLGLRLYRNLPTPDITQNHPRTFADISTDVKLGPEGVAATLKGDHLLVADWNGDGRADLLYGAGTGVIIVNTPAGFSIAADAGVQYPTAKARPAKIDLNGDKLPDLVVPHATGIRLLLNGGGKFTDVTASSGDAARGFGAATSVTAGDLDGDGKVDLVVGCLRAPNRLFRGQGGGKFTDATVESGLIQRIFNTRGVAMADVNRDGVGDVLFNNEGQESSMLLGAASRPAAQQVGRND